MWVLGAAGRGSGGRGEESHTRVFSSDHDPLKHGFCLVMRPSGGKKTPDETTWGMIGTPVFNAAGGMGIAG